MIILGIDPGTSKVGFALIKKQKNEKVELVEFGCLELKSLKEQADRLKKISWEIGKLINGYSPSVLAIERLFFNKNQKTALQVAEARGVIISAAASRNLEIREFTPLEVKMALCGYGRADKGQVQIMIKRLLDLERMPEPDDAADAAAIALTACYTDKMLR